MHPTGSVAKSDFKPVAVTRKQLRPPSGFDLRNFRVFTARAAAQIRFVLAHHTTRLRAARSQGR
jgi:hypothetical protein